MASSCGAWFILVGIHARGNADLLRFINAANITSKRDAVAANKSSPFCHVDFVFMNLYIYYGLLYNLGAISY